MRHRARNWLKALGVIALLLGLLPEVRTTGGATTSPEMGRFVLAHPGSEPATREYRLGLPGSPLFYYRHERDIVTLADGSFGIRDAVTQTVGWLSGSSLLLGTGVGMLLLARWLRPMTGGTAEEGTDGLPVPQEGRP